MPNEHQVLDYSQLSNFREYKPLGSESLVNPTNGATSTLRFEDPMNNSFDGEADRDRSVKEIEIQFES